MSTNPWLAVDVTTSPKTRARVLRGIWDRYLTDGELDAVRLPIAESWQRSRAAGLDPTASRAPTLFGDRDEVAERWEAHPLEAAAPLIREWLGSVADESEHLIVVSDADGLLLWVEGNAKLRSAAADAMNFVEGSLWSERGAGTNAIGTAVAADHPVQVHAAEHLSEVVHGWTCSAAPVHDPEDGRLLGIIDLTGRMRTAHPHSYAVALETARAVEADLRSRLDEHDAELRLRYLARIESNRERVALASLSGRVIADHHQGFVRAERVAIPPGGGEMILPSGSRAVAEPADDEAAFIIRPLRSPRGSGSPIQPSSRPAGRERGERTRRSAARASASGRGAGRVAPCRHARGAASGRDRDLRRGGRRSGSTLQRDHGHDLPLRVRRVHDRGRLLERRRTTRTRRHHIRAGRRQRRNESAAVARPLPMRRLRRPLRPRRGAGQGSRDALDHRRADRRRGTGLGRHSRQYEPRGAVPRRLRDASAPVRRAGGDGDLQCRQSRRARGLTGEDRRHGGRDPPAYPARPARRRPAAARLAGARAPDRRVQGSFGVERAPRRAGPNGTRAGGSRRGPAGDLAGHPPGDPLEGRARAGAQEPVRSRRDPGGAGSASRRSVAGVDRSRGVLRRLRGAHERGQACSRASTRGSPSRWATGSCEVAIRDDGAGGADPSRGSGLIGLRDRVEALGGTIHVESPPGKGTGIQVALPFTSSPSSSDHVRRGHDRLVTGRAPRSRTFPSRAWRSHWSWRCRSSWARWGDPSACRRHAEPAPAERGDAFTIRVAGLLVLGEEVEGVALVGDLLAAVGPRGGSDQLGLRSVSDRRLARSHERRPRGRACARARAHVPGVRREQVDGAALRVDEGLPEVCLRDVDRCFWLGAPGTPSTRSLGRRRRRRRRLPARQAAPVPFAPGG